MLHVYDVPAIDCSDISLESFAWGIGDRIAVLVLPEGIGLELSSERAPSVAPSICRSHVSSGVGTK